MFVVPVSGDKVKTKDDSDPRTVSSFSSLKDEPAVYLVPTTSRDRYIYFSDIVEINGVKVEYEPESKVFEAMGPLKRRFNLPQPKDTISVKLIDVPYNDEPEELTVSSIRLHNKKYGIARGLLVCADKSCFSLSDILDLKRADWTETFHPINFRKFYHDYLAIGAKAKG